MATLTELQTELQDVKSALERIRKGGQSYTISAGSGGSSRMIQNASYSELIKHKATLEAQIATITGRRAVRFDLGW